MSYAITVRGLDEREKSWLQAEAREAGISMEEFVRRMIRKQREAGRAPGRRAFRTFSGSTSDRNTEWSCRRAANMDTGRLSFPRTSSPRATKPDRDGFVASRRERRLGDDALPAGWAGRRVPGRGPAADAEVAGEELLDAPVEGDPVVGVAEAVALGIGVRLVLDAVFFERRHREFEVQEGRPDSGRSVLDEDRGGDVESEAGQGLGLVVDLGPFRGKAAVAVEGDRAGIGVRLVLGRVLRRRPRVRSSGRAPGRRGHRAGWTGR